MAFLRRNTIKKFDKKVWLATPTMHGEELKLHRGSLRNELDVHRGRKYQ